MKIINNWKNAEKYEKEYEKIIDKRKIWQFKQNYPDVIIDDIIETLKLPNSEKTKTLLYAILLRRGVNKWLAVRKLLIRLKKYYVAKTQKYKKLMDEAKKNKDWQKFWYYRGLMNAFNQTRKETAVLCKSPRWVIFVGKNIGLIDTVGCKNSNAKNFIELYKKLNEIKFEK